MGLCFNSQVKAFSETIWFWLPQTPPQAPHQQHWSAGRKKTFLKTTGCCCHAEALPLAPCTVFSSKHMYTFGGRRSMRWAFSLCLQMLKWGRKRMDKEAQWKHTPQRWQEMMLQGAGERIWRIKHKAGGEEGGSPFLGEGRAVWGMIQECNFSGTGREKPQLMILHSLWLVLHIPSSCAPRIAVFSVPRPLSPPPQVLPAPASWNPNTSKGRKTRHPGYCHTWCHSVPSSGEK